MRESGIALNRPSPEGVRAQLDGIGRAQSLAQASEIVRYGAFVGSRIHCFASLPRAMNYSRELIEEAAGNNSSIASGTVVLADTMTESKGRFTRSWHAPLGGVWGCLIHAETLLPESRNFIPMATGVACCEAFLASGISASIRWVNDILAGGRKLAGFLVETYTERKFGEEFTLVGFGINVNNREFPGEIEDTAGSMRQILGRKSDISLVTTQFLARLAWNFGLLHHEEQFRLHNGCWSGRAGLHRILARWLELTDCLDRRVVYGFDVMHEPQYQAHLIGVDELGGLQLRLDDGYVKTEYSGEIRYLEMPVRK